MRLLTWAQRATASSSIIVRYRRKFPLPFLSASPLRLMEHTLYSMPEKFFTSEEARELQERVWGDLMEVLEEVAHKF
jgi:hypothetical protein